jgi:sugar phosphate isomerase/epimerase
MNAMQQRLALHTWTLDSTPLADTLRIARATGWDAVELRRKDFERAFAAGQSTEDVLDLVRASGMPVAAVGVEAGWAVDVQLAAWAAAVRAAWVAAAPAAWAAGAA